MKHRLERFFESVFMWLAWHLPHVLVRWCFIRVAAHATTGQWREQCPDDVSIMDAAGRWETKGTS